MEKKNLQQSADRLEDLIHKLCDDIIDDTEYRELEELLSKNSSFKKRYVELMDVSTGLRDWANITTLGESAVIDRKAASLAATRRNPPWYLKHHFLLLYAAALLGGIFCLGLYVGSGYQLRVAQKAPANVPVSTDEGNPIVQSGEDYYVARVVEVSPDATWGKSQPREFLLRMASDERIDLQTGTAHVEFSSGASVILHGPAAFMPVTHNTGRLLSGRVTGRAENGNFSLLTPAAEVIDLGTEFGVAVDNSLNTDICVFDGEVDISLASMGVTEKRAGNVRLAEGMAVRVDRHGVIDESADISRTDFLRYISGEASTGNELSQISLVDIIAGGSGRSKWLAGAIDPCTGNWDRQLPKFDSKRDRLGDGRYMVNESSPFIDGVFIPSLEGSNVEINSSGDVFDFGRNDGASWGPIWSRRLIPHLRATTSIISDFWGTDTLAGVLDLIEKSRYGVVGMHANVGLTIDLRAIRLLEGRSPSHFHAEIFNLDNSRSHNPQYAKENRPSVDFRVFIDGIPKFEQLDFGRDEGEVMIDFPLTEKDRFLTLVTTDAGNSKYFDHLVIIDPYIQLK